jgi:hypothetical protein
MFKLTSYATFLVTALALSCSASPPVANLITNGDFELGNTSFTSEYPYFTYNTLEGQYGINTDAHAFNQNFFLGIVDHTSGSGKMMLVNGSEQPGTVVWSQSVAVMPNSMYAVSAWVRTLYPSSVAKLRFTVNGTQIGGIFSPPLSTASWSEFSTTWTSQGSNSALIQIVDTNTDWSGNDFALDDISFIGDAVPEPPAALLMAGLGSFLALSRASATSRALTTGTCKLV